MVSHHKPAGPTQRMLRVGELVRHALAELLARDEIVDARLEGVVITVPEVRMSPDLKHAKAYVMPLGGGRADEVARALNQHQRFIRGQIGPQLALKFTPDISFFVDTTFEEADRIESLLRSERVRRDLADRNDEDER